MSRDLHCLHSFRDCAAPLEGSERQPPALHEFGCQRLRRRGPRSQAAILRRSVPKHRRTLPGSCLGESRRNEPVLLSCTLPRDPNQNNGECQNSENANENVKPAIAKRVSLGSIVIYLINIQCMCARLAELSHHLEMYRPHVVCIQETWLDESIKEPIVPGYNVCSRRDRHAGSNRVDVLTLVREDFNGLVHIANSKDEERSWHFLQTGIETILIANWYRPGASEFNGFADLYAELAEYFMQATGVVILGDLNIHHKR